jgi:TRAP-type transport system periplasmic protein
MRIVRIVKVIMFLMAVVFLGTVSLPEIGTTQQSGVIELTYSSPFNPDHAFCQADKQWMAKIETETRGRVKFKPFYGGTLIASGDGIQELEKGVADVAQIFPGAMKTGYHFAKGSFLFFAAATLETGPHIFFELLNKFPEIEREYQGIKVISWGSGSSYYLSSRKPVRKITDMKGMRIRSNGELINVLKNLGAEGTTTAPADIYTNLQKGVLDGAITPPEALKSQRFFEVVKYTTNIKIYRAMSGQRAMNLNSYNKLPPDVRRVIDDNILWYSRTCDSVLGNADKEGLAFAKTKGVEIITLPADEIQRLHAEISKEAIQQAKKLDERGLQGSKIYQEIESLLQKYNK